MVYRCLFQSPQQVILLCAENSNAKLRVNCLMKSPKKARAPRNLPHTAYYIRDQKALKLMRVPLYLSSPSESPASQQPARLSSRPPDRNLLPRSPTVNRFRFPRTLRVPRRSTRDTLTRPMGGLSKPPQTPPAIKNNSSSRQQIIHQSGQRKVSRYHVGSSCSAPGPWGPKPQRPPTSPRSNAAKIGKLLRQRAVGQSGPCVVGKVLVGKTKDGRLFVLPAIPLEHLRNKGFTLLPDSSVKKDLERTNSAPHPPSGKSCLLPPLPQAQRKRTVSKTRSAPLHDASRK